jgi:hypothetical protein
MLLLTSQAVNVNAAIVLPNHPIKAVFARHIPAPPYTSRSIVFCLLKLSTPKFMLSACEDSSLVLQGARVLLVIALG